MQADSPGTTSLPEADAASLAHSDRVAAFIREKIEAGAGSIGFAEFMQHALYAPGLGYYVAGARKFGADGDFVTAPELSPLFGGVLARQCAGLLEQTGGELLELGAGSGALAIDLLRKLDALGQLPQRYFILEISPELQQRQQDRIREELPEHLPRVEWLSALPADFDGVVIANEVADALPAERFTVAKDGIRQHGVTATDRGFAWHDGPAPPPLQQAVEEIAADTGRQFVTPFTSEVSLALPAWIASLAESLRRGFVFLFDYGVSRREYYAPDRRDGWLRCHFRHHAHSDPLILAGIQDITSWVDFSLLAAAAADSGFEIRGYAAQGPFLLAGGLEAELAEFANLPTDRQLQLSQQVKLLTLPGEMGERFKCLGLSRGAIDAPAAFAGIDRAHAL